MGKQFFVLAHERAVGNIMPGIRHAHSVLAAAVEQGIAQDGNQCQGDEQRREQQRTDGDAELAEHHTRQTAGQADGQEDGNRCEGGCRDGQRNLLGALDTRNKAVTAVRPVVKDVFQYDDRVIHDHADAHGDAAERHHVHGDIKHLHDEENRDDTDGHGHRNDRGCAQIAQEDKQHNGCEQHAEDDVLDNRVDGHVNHVTLVHEQRPVQRGLERGHFVECVLGALGHLQGVGVRLLIDRDRDTGFTADLGDGGLLLGCDVDVSNLAQTHGAAGRQRNQGVCNVADRAVLAVGTHREALIARLHFACGQRDILCRQHLRDVRHRQAVACQAIGVGIDGDLIFVAARDIDRSHAVDALEGGLDVILRDGLQFGKVCALEADGHDRHGIDIDGHGHGCVGILGQKALDAVDAVTQIDHSLVHIGTVGKGDHDHGRTLGRERLDLIHTRHARARRLDGLGDHVLDFLRACVRVSRIHDRHRQLNIGQQGERQRGKAHDAEYDDQHIGHDGCDLMFQTKVCDIHGVSSPETTRTAAPSDR